MADHGLADITPARMPEEAQISGAIRKKLSETGQMQFKQVPDGAIGAVAVALRNVMIKSEELDGKVDAVCKGLLRLVNEHGDYGTKLLSEGGMFAEVFLETCGATDRCVDDDGNRLLRWEHLSDMVKMTRTVVDLQPDEFIPREKLLPPERTGREHMPVISAPGEEPKKDERVEKVLSFMETLPCSIGPYRNWKEFVMANTKRVEISDKLEGGETCVAGLNKHGVTTLSKNYVDRKDGPMVAAILLAHETAHYYADVSGRREYVGTSEALEGLKLFIAPTPGRNLRVESFAVRAALMFIDDVKKNCPRHIEDISPDDPTGRVYFGETPIRNMVWFAAWQLDVLHERVEAAEQPKERPRDTTAKH